MRSTNMHMWKAIDKRYSADSDEQARPDCDHTAILIDLIHAKQRAYTITKRVHCNNAHYKSRTDNNLYAG